MICSAFKIVLIRCATISTVLSFVRFFKAFRRATSVLKSSAEKLSSKINTSGRFAIALAIESLCFWPPDTFDPPCEIGLSYLFGFASINSVACAICAASFISCPPPSGFPNIIFDAISPENNSPFWGTYPSLSLKSCCVTSRISVPSKRILPSVTS